MEAQVKTRRDFVAPGSELSMKAVPLMSSGEGAQKDHVLKVNGHGEFPIRPIAHEQIASRTGIPNKYYEAMRVAAPDLLVTNVNHWFHAADNKRMVRTLDGKARAFLSDRYRPLDNLDLARVTLPLLSKMGVRVESSELTEKRLYIKAVTEKITAEVRKGDVVQAGIVVSNSEIGMGSVKVEPMVFRLVCTNGLIINDAAMKKYHVGRAGAEGDLASEFFRDETRKADDKAFWMKVRDVVEGSFQADVFNRWVDRMRDATERIIDVNPVGVVEVVRRDHALDEAAGSDILQHLIRGGDLTQYGLLNAVTRASQDVPDYDRATELERLGGEILSLEDGEWNRLLAGADRAARSKAPVAA